MKTENTSTIPEYKIEKLVRDHFPLTPAEIISYLNLKRPIYRATAAHGHFGRSGAAFTWEKTNIAPKLKAAAAKLAK